MTDALRIAELERQLANVVRLGKIAQVDHGAGRVRVQIGQLRTAWLPWVTASANSKRRSWTPPQVGEQVVVLAVGGELRTAVVLPALFSDAADAPEDSGNVWVHEFEDGTRLEYDIAEHRLRATVEGSVEVTASGGITVTGNVTITGDVNVTGAITASGEITAGTIPLTTHKHTGVQTGGGNTAGPVP